MGGTEGRSKYSAEDNGAGEKRMVGARCEERPS